MAKQSLLRGVLFVCAVLILNGCKKSETAADAKGADEVAVLDAGQEPRAPLRYNIAPGTTTTSTMTFRVATLAKTADAAALTVLPGLRLHIVSGPATQTKDGVSFPVDIVKAEALVPQDYDEKMAKDLRSGAAILDEVGAVVEIDDRGRLLAGEFNEAAKRSDIPLRLLRMIVNTRSTLTRVLLPEEPVGLGARWESRKEIRAYGFKVQQVDTYTLVDRVGDEIMLNISVQQLGLPQRLEFPEEGIEISVESMSANASGQIILSLSALESDASASGSASDRISVKTADATEDIEIDEEFEVQVANTTDLKPVEPTRRGRKSKRRSRTD